MARRGFFGRFPISRVGFLAGALGFALVLAGLSPAGGEAAPPGGLSKSTRILGVRHFSTAGYSRLVLILSRETFDFESGRLEGPPRIFIDIPKGELGEGTAVPPFRNGESLIRRLRLGQNSSDRLRLVVDLSRGDVRHRIFTLPDPDRIVLDLRGPAGAPRSARAAPPPPPVPRKEAVPRQRREETRIAPPPRLPPADGGGKSRRAMDIATRFRTGRGRIVLDPGHGGKDPGATGLYGLVEKHFVLDISLRAARALRKILPGNRVILTRTRDRYLPLSERTSIANDNDADIFVSIHANSAPHRGTRGIETYLLSEASSERALEVAARESETTIARMSDLQKILNSLMLRSKVMESQQLAEQVHNSMLSQTGRRFVRVKDLGVKRGPFYVLVGAQMPSILIETAFITNPQEARRARSPRYRQSLADGIAEGIARFVGMYGKRAGWRGGPGTARRLRTASP